MGRFLVTYHGGGMPADPAQAGQARAAFGEWLARAGSAVADPGAPVRPAARVPSSATAASAGIGGYTVIEAESLQAVLDILKSHPFVARGGTLQVHESIPA